MSVSAGRPLEGHRQLRRSGELLVRRAARGDVHSKNHDDGRTSMNAMVVAPGRSRVLRCLTAVAALCLAASAAAQTPSSSCDALGALKLPDVTVTAAVPVDAGTFKAPGTAA